MKKVILYIALAAFKMADGQYNYIKNNGFDQLKNPNKQYWPVPYGTCNGDVDDCVDWNTRTVKYQSNCGTICGATTVLEHSPDLRGTNCGNQGISPFSGDYCIGAGAYNQELFQQNLKKELIPGRYILTGFTKRKGIRSTNAIISVYLNDDYVEYDCEDDCNAFKNLDNCYYELDSDPILTRDYYFDNECKSANGNINWHNFNYEFNINREKINTLSLVYEGQSKRQKLACFGSDDYMYFDELFLQRKSCYCIDNLWIENRTFKDKEEVQASNTIRLGFNVDNVTTNGNVVFDGKDIVVRAGQSIKIEPGVVIKSGANFNARIENCKTKFQGKTPKVAYFSNAALQNASNPINRNWVLVGEDATDYFIQIFNRWGELVAEQADQFKSDNTAEIYPPYSLPQGTYVYQLWVYNCDNSSEIKKGSLSMLKSTTQNKEDDIVSFYPNPAHNNLKINIPGLKEDDNIQIEIFSLDGKLNIKKSINTKLSSNSNLIEEVDIENLGKGIYILKVLKNEVQYFTDKFVKL